MDHERFRRYLRRQGRSESAAIRCIAMSNAFSESVSKNPDEISAGDLRAYACRLEGAKKGSSKTALWALIYYFRFLGRDDLADCASQMRQAKIQRKPFKLASFRGVDADRIAKLASHSLENAEQIRRAGDTPEKRSALARTTDLPLDFIVELVKLSDLSRITGLKAIRARLYHDAGYDTLNRIANADPDIMRQQISDYVERSSFDGIPPTPKEAASAVSQAKALPPLIQF